MKLNIKTNYSETSNRTKCRTLFNRLLGLSMKIDSNKSIRAIFVAPLTAGSGFVIAYWDSNDDFINTLSVLAFITPLAYPIPLISILILGLPVYFFLKYFNVLNFYTLSFVGLPLGYLFSAITGDLNDPLWLKTTCISGLLVSTAAALVMLKKPNRLNPLDAQKTRTSV